MPELTIINDNIEQSFVDLVFLLKEAKVLSKNQNLESILVDNTSKNITYFVVEDLSAIPRIFTPEQELILKTKKLTDLKIRKIIYTFLIEKVRITTLRELVQLSQRDLLKHRKFGKKSLFDLVAALSELGLALKNNN